MSPVWTEREETALRFEWHLATKLQLMRRLPGRSWTAIRHHASLIGLPAGVPEGCATVNALAERFGVHPDSLRAIFAWAGLRVRALYPSPTRPSRRPTTERRGPHRYVNEEEARAAFERWLGTETPSGAARRRGLNHQTVRRWLTDAGLVAPLEASAEARVVHRVPSAEIDRVIAERARERASSTAARAA